MDDLQKGNDKNILDITDNFKVDMIVPSDWGEGKVVSVDKVNKKVVLKIEGVEKEFSMLELITSIYCSICAYIFKGKKWNW